MFSLSGSKNLYSNEIIQCLKVSRNKEWDNYRYKLGREKEGDFNKSNLIEARKAISQDYRFIILTREGINIFEIFNTNFNPIEFYIEITSEFITSNIKTGNFTRASIASLQMNDDLLIEKALKNSNDLKSTISILPITYVPLFYEYIIKQDLNDYHSRM